MENRYLPPIWGANVTESRCIEVVQPSMRTATEGQTPRKETIHKTSWPKRMDNNRFEQPLQPPVRGANMTIPDHDTMKQKSGMTAAEVGRDQNALTEPSRCQATDVEVEGAVTDTMASIPYRCCDCGIGMTTGGNSAMNAAKDKEPRPIRTYPVRPEGAPVDGGTDILRPMTILDVPALRLPGVFLKLAEEVRNSKVVDGQPTDMRAVQPHRSGQAGRVLITEIMNSFPVLGSGEFGFHSDNKNRVRWCC